MALIVERWLVKRLKQQPYGFGDHAVDHVGNAQTPLASPALGYPYPPDVPRLVGALEQFLGQSGQEPGEVLAHYLDAPAVGTCGTLI